MRDDATCVMRSRHKTGRVYEPTQVVLGPRPAPGAGSTSGSHSHHATLSELARPLMLAAQSLSEPGFKCVSLVTLRAQLTRQQQQFEQACQRGHIDRYAIRLAQRVLRCWLWQAGKACQLAHQAEGRQFLSSLAIGEHEHAELLAALELLLLQPQRRPECLMLVRDCLAAGFSLAQLAPNGVADKHWQVRIAEALAPPVLALTAIADSAAPSPRVNPDRNIATASKAPVSQRHWIGLLLLILGVGMVVTCWQAWRFQQQIDTQLAGWLASGEQLTRSPQSLLAHYQSLTQWLKRQQGEEPLLSQWWFTSGQWEQPLVKVIDTWSREQLMPVVAAELVKQWSVHNVDEVTAWRISVDYRALSGQLSIAPELALAGLSRILADDPANQSAWRGWLRNYWGDSHWPQLTPADWQPLEMRLRGMSTVALVLALLESEAATTVHSGDALPSSWLDAEKPPVEPLYTGPGFSQVYWPLRERWLHYVVSAGRHSDTEALGTQTAQLDKAYWRTYQVHWQQLPERVRWRSARDVTEWLAQLDTWRDETGFLVQLASWEANLRAVGVSAGQNEEPALLSEEAWAQSVRSAAASLTVAFQSITTASNPDQAVLHWVRAELVSDARSERPATPFSHLYRLSDHGPAPAALWLRTWLTDGWTLLVKQAENAIAQLYQQDVYAFYRARLANCFPFQFKAEVDCTPADVQAFFARDGRLDRFQLDVIAPLQSAGSFASLLPSPLPVALQRPVLSPATAQVLAQWREQSATEQGTRQVRLIPQRLDAAVRRVLVRQGARSYPFQHGLHDPALLTWSPQDVTEPVVVRFQDYFGAVSERHFSGPWAVLRLFSRFPPRQQDARGGYWRITAGDHEAFYRVGAETIAWYRAWQGLAGIELPAPAVWQSPTCHACQSESP